MYPVIFKTFGGLSVYSYFRHFLFGLIFPMMFIFMFSQSHKLPSHIGLLSILSIVNAFLYPYSRFIYEATVDYVVGENIFILNAFVAMFSKIMTMSFCWVFAIYISPIGLAYLYYFNTKNQSKVNL